MGNWLTTVSYVAEFRGGNEADMARALAGRLRSRNPEKLRIWDDNSITFGAVWFTPIVTLDSLMGIRSGEVQICSDSGRTSVNAHLKLWAPQVLIAAECLFTAVLMASGFPGSGHPGVDAIILASFVVTLLLGVALQRVLLQHAFHRNVRDSAYDAGLEKLD